jgi:hypothetical protein
MRPWEKTFPDELWITVWSTNALAWSNSRTA